MSALALVERLLASGTRSLDVDWEALLRINYCVLVGDGAHVLDIGGSEGAHSHCFLVDLNAASVDIFEPIPDMAEKLRVRFAGRDEVIVHQLALSDRDMRSSFHVKADALAESGLCRKNVYSDGCTDTLVIDVVTRRLDGLDLRFAPAFIKADIEGGEINMLLGAADTIAVSRPIISVEYGYIGYEAFGHSAEALPTWARANGYAIHDLMGNWIDDFGSCVNRYYWDYLLIPIERVEALSEKLSIIRKLTASLPMSAWRNTNLDVVNRNG